jgi:uncharacterized delta-60 repeat protein
MKKSLLILLIATISIGALSQPGSLDKTFGNDGKVYPNLGLFKGRIQGYNSIVVQPDNKFLLCGVNEDNTTYGDVALMRCNPDGSPDKNFGGRGYVTTDIENVRNAGRSVALQKDGKIVVAATVENKVAVIRYNNDGSLDESFANHGYNVIDLKYAYDDAYSVAVQDDQKIILSGATGDGYAADFFAARFNTDGTLDTSFGDSGISTIDIGGEDYARGMAIETDGKILISGYTDALNNTLSSFFVARLQADGTIDTTFNKRGYNITSVGENYLDTWCYSMGLQNDGKIVLVGAAWYAPDIIDNLLIRYNNDGSLDNSFGSDGIVITILGNLEAWSTDLAFQSDNKILVSGYYRILNDQDIIVYRYNYDGTIDYSFGKGGYTDIDLGSYDEMAMTTALQAGKLLVAGSRYEYMFVLRYLLDLENGIPSTAASAESCQVYPNPFKDEGVLKYTLESPGSISIGLFDLSGKLVQILVNESYRPQGEQTENLRLPEDFKPGLYLVRIWNSSLSITAKLLKE